MLRRERHEDGKRPPLRDEGQIFGIHRTKIALRMDTATRLGKPRPFEMKAEQAGHPLANALVHSVDGGCNLTALIRNQRRHQGGDAQPGVSLCDRAQ